MKLKYLLDLMHCLNKIKVIDKNEKTVYEGNIYEIERSGKIYEAIIILIYDDFTIKIDYEVME